MGDRWTLSLECPYCQVMNHDVYYAPTCGFADMKCQACGARSEISERFVALKGEGRDA